MPYLAHLGVDMCHVWHYNMVVTKMTQNNKGEVARLKLAEMRKARGLTQDELAKKAGVSRRTIARIEVNPEYNANVKLLKRLADALGCTTNELISD